MSLRDAVLSGRIVRFSIDRADRPLAGHTALQLTSHFFRAALL